MIIIRLDMSKRGVTRTFCKSRHNMIDLRSLEVKVPGESKVDLMDGPGAEREG